jgi:hypothetical protein
LGFVAIPPFPSPIELDASAAPVGSTAWVRLRCCVRLSLRPKPLRCRLQVTTGQMNEGELWTSRRWRLKSPRLLKSFTEQPETVHL